MTVDVPAGQPSPPSAKRKDLLNRMWRAIKLDRNLYEEVEHDENASKQVIAVIGLVSIAQAIGLSLTNRILGEGLTRILVRGVLEFVITLVGLVIWSYLVYLVGTRLFKGVATQQETWRTAGFARSPGVFLVIPFVGLFVNIWLIIAQAIAVREALDVPTGRAILTCIISFIPYVLLLGIVEILLASFI